MATQIKRFSYSNLPVECTHHILTFLQESPLSEVNRTWRTENGVVLEPLVDTIRALILSPALDHLGPLDNLAAHQYIRQAVEILDEARNLDEEVHHLFVTLILQYRRFIANDRDRAFRFRTPHFDQLNPVLATLSAAEDPATIQQLNRQIRAEALNWFARENIHARLTESARKLGVELNPERHTSRLVSALGQSLKENALALNADKLIPRTTQARSADECLDVERELIEYRFNDPAQEPALQGMRGDPFRSAYEIRREVYSRWVVGMIPLLPLTVLSGRVVPEEIGAYTYDAFFPWDGPIKAMPWQFDCVRWAHVRLLNTDFPNGKIPRLFDEMASLKMLEIENNRTPISEIREQLWRTQCDHHLFSHMVNAWVSAKKMRVVYGFPLESVRDMPYEMYWLQRRTLPYIPCPQIISLQPDMGFFEWTWKGLLFFSLFLINSPIFLINYFITMTICPLVMRARRWMGKSSMIRLPG